MCDKLSEKTNTRYDICMWSTSRKPARLELNWTGPAVAEDPTISQALKLRPYGGIEMCVLLLLLFGVWVCDTLWRFC